MNAGLSFACGAVFALGFLLPAVWLAAEQHARHRIAAGKVKALLLWAKNDFYDVLAKHLEVHADPGERPRDFVKFAISEAFREYEDRGHG